MIDPSDDGIDDEGNNPVHLAAKHDDNFASFQRLVSSSPHFLFMLNKFGQTPLDVAIEETLLFEKIIDTSKENNQAGLKP